MPPTGKVEESAAQTVPVQLLQNGPVFETFICSCAEYVERVRLAVLRVWSGRKSGEMGEELAGLQKAIESSAECCPKHAFVMKCDRGGVVQSQLGLAENTDGDRE